MVVVQTLAAVAGRLPRRRRRARPADPEPPQEVPLTRLTVIPAESSEAEAAAASSSGWRGSRGGRGGDRRRPPDGELDPPGATDRHAGPVRPGARARDGPVVRVGYGTGEGLAEGRWENAFEVPLPAQRRRRTQALRPQERLAAVLAGREPIDLCEPLLLRARADLDRTARARLPFSCARASRLCSPSCRAGRGPTRRRTSPPSRTAARRSRGRPTMPSSTTFPRSGRPSSPRRCESASASFAAAKRCGSSAPLTSLFSAYG